MTTPIGERMTKVETQVTEISEKLDSIDASLKSLVSLKDKGAGAVWLVSLIGLSGVLAFGKSIWYWVTGQGA